MNMYREQYLHGWATRCERQFAFEVGQIELELLVPQLRAKLMPKRDLKRAVLQLALKLRFS